MREIERKFLVCSDGWRSGVIRSRAIRQGYLNEIDRCSVRVRIADGKATLNIKSAEMGISRNEYEYLIDYTEAGEILESLCVGTVVEKTRYDVVHDGMTWEVDVFAGANAGLVIAEIELDDEDQAFGKPAWAGKEVTGDARYYNSALANRPHARWDELPSAGGGC